MQVRQQPLTLRTFDLEIACSESSCPFRRNRAKIKPNALVPIYHTALSRRSSAKV